MQKQSGCINTGLLNNVVANNNCHAAVNTAYIDLINLILESEMICKPAWINYRSINFVTA